MVLGEPGGRRARGFARPTRGRGRVELLFGRARAGRTRIETSGARENAARGPSSSGSHVILVAHVTLGEGTGARDCASLGTG